MISVTLTNEHADGLLDDLKRIFPSLLAGTPLPPMQEQPRGDIVTTNTPRVSDKPGSRTRKPKDEPTKEEAKADAGESSAPAATEGTTALDASTASSTVEVPDIEVVRAKLKQMGATDGLGHDKVFEVLGKYKATNASSVPTEKRAELIAEIDGLLEDARIAAIGKSK